MATSTEKVLQFVEELQDRPDEELRDMLPLPPSMLRMALGAGTLKLPDDPALLDDYALGAARFLLAMRSDDAELAQLLVGDQVVEIEAPA